MNSEYHRSKAFLAELFKSFKFYFSSTSIAQHQLNPSNMQFTALLSVAFASIAAAAPDFAIGTKEYSISAKDTAQLNQITKAVIDAASSWQASVTAQPEYSSAWSELVEFQETHSGVPEGVTATDSIIQYASTPTWHVVLTS